MRVVVQVPRQTISRIFGGLASLLAFGVLMSIWLIRVENTEISFSQNLPPERQPPLQQVPVADLILPEAAIQGSAERRRVVGTVRNRSMRPHTNVLVTFTLTRRGDTVGVAQAFVNRIEADSTAPFVTNEFTHARVQALLKGITADSR